MRHFISKTTDWVYKITASARFFVVTVLLLIFQSVWMAFTAIYPMPFDEYVHVGAIQLYANQWSPFITTQPANTGLLGDLTRAGSYLFHYLMSFPYRVLDIFVDSEMVIVISLRLINIAMVVGAFLLFRKLFVMWKVPKRVMNIAFLLFVFTPIAPFVAAHVNYDNLVLLIMPTMLIFGTRLIIDRGDTAWNGAWFAIFSLMGLLAKETFAPLMLVTWAYVTWRLWREHGIKKFWYGLWKSIKENIRHISYVIALIILVVMGGLVLERYGGNIVQYRSYIVDCDEVQPRSFCENYGPWYRDNVTNVNNRPAEPPYGNPASFSQYWVTRMMRGFFVAFQHTPTEVVWDKEPFGPIVARPLLPVQIWVGTVALVSGLAAMVFQRRRILTSKPMRFALVVSGLYLLSVWVFNYHSYLEIWKAEAIQARYTYPILLLLFMLLLQSINWTITSRRLKSAMVLLLIPLYIWGGGIAVWLIRADDTWRWQNATVQTVNQKVQTFLRYTVIH